jgi:hypothetical protein
VSCGFWKNWCGLWEKPKALWFVASVKNAAILHLQADPTRHPHNLLFFLKAQPNRASATNQQWPKKKKKSIRAILVVQHYWLYNWCYYFNFKFTNIVLHIWQYKWSQMKLLLTTKL